MTLVNDEMRSESGKELNELTIEVHNAENSTPVIFLADGTGRLVDHYDWEGDQFKHDLNLAELVSQFDSQAALEDYLTDYFWQQINPKLDDPLLRDYSDLDGHELEFVKGNQAEFDHLMHLFILTEPGLEKADEREVVIESASQEDEPHLEKEWGYASERLERLVKLALAEHRPYGYSYEYNDERGNRRSGYSLSPAYLTYDLDELIQSPAREKMASRSELRQWLIARSQLPQEFGLEEWEKIV